MNSIQPTSKILFVSAEENSAISTALESVGFKVELVNDIESAESALKKIKPDLILLFTDMTGDHGLNFCSQARAAQINQIGRAHV